MPIKQPETDETKLNMTPMIDIVFNLVTFFMLSVDLAHKDLAALTLPKANKGVEDKDPKPEGRTRFVVNLEDNGNIYFKGHSWPLSVVADGASTRPATPAEQEKTLDLLKGALRELTKDPKLREPDGSSMVEILIRGDRTAKWKYVQWVMQVCADPQIKIYKMQFAVEGPKKD
jgi:biopolymer transport protein ExbD